jgi:hypothetical protein
MRFVIPSDRDEAPGRIQARLALVTCEEKRSLALPMIDMRHRNFRLLVCDRHRALPCATLFVAVAHGSKWPISDLPQCPLSRRCRGVKRTWRIL